MLYILESPGALRASSILRDLMTGDLMSKMRSISFSTANTPSLDTYLAGNKDTPEFMLRTWVDIEAGSRVF